MKVEAPMDEISIHVDNFNLFYGNFRALIDVSLKVKKRQVTAIIGPSGCGKSTLLRSMNRMNDMFSEVRTEGQMVIDGNPVYGRNVDLVALRKRVGMVFQRPNPFPLSVYENVAFGPKLHMSLSKRQLDEKVEKSLEQVGMWESMKDKLDRSALTLSGEQQQRLCIARLAAVSPDVLLMDEPCSALDPVATTKIEELMHSLKDRYTIVTVTHNMQQAARVSDYTAFFYLGKLIEFDETKKIFMNPSKKQTEDYITGRFG